LKGWASASLPRRLAFKFLHCDDVFRIVERDGLLKRVSIMGYEVDLVLDEAEMAQANKRIAANYRIQKMRFKSSKSDEK
jgi:hypothetical protein